MTGEMGAMRPLLRPRAEGRRGEGRERQMEMYASIGASHETCRGPGNLTPLHVRQQRALPSPPPLLTCFSCSSCILPCTSATKLADTLPTFFFTSARLQCGGGVQQPLRRISCHCC